MLINQYYVEHLLLKLNDTTYTAAVLSKILLKKKYYIIGEQECQRKDLSKVFKEAWSWQPEKSRHREIYRSKPKTIDSCQVSCMIFPNYTTHTNSLA